MFFRRSPRGLVPLLFLATMVMASGCARGTDLVSPKEPQSGTIAGRVIDSRSGAPIPDVTIRTSPVKPNVTTDAMGRFELTGLELEVEYTLTALKPGYTTSTVRVPVSRAQSFFSVEFTLLRFGFF